MKKSNLFQKLLSMLLCLCMILSYIPAGAVFTSAAVDDVTDRVADPNTMNQWQDYFGKDKVSTEFAGGVWTDKSVLTSADDFMAQITMDDPDNNFLIALSALAANQQILGYTSAPVDVMLVLDVSGSMQSSSKATTMVQAANRAIDTLLKQNNNNRVGVVLYSGNSSTGASNSSTATVILPLDRYTSNETEQVQVGGDRWNPVYETFNVYLNISNNNVSVESTVRNSDNDRVSDSKNVSGGTYIQNGLYKAWGEFSKVTDVKVPAGQAQAGAQRTPVMVLMSDGRPTTATIDYNDVDSSSTAYGNGNESTTSWRTVFLTQLTAAWAKTMMQNKYGTTPKFYTLGLATGTDNYATAVLDPGTSYDTLDGYWNNFFHETPNANGNVEIIPNTNSWWQNSNAWSVYKDSNVKSQDYVDLYKLAENADDLLAAFKTITDSIELDAAGHVTLVEEAGEDFSGYITITDELGIFMDVKDVKGLVLGNTLFTGHELAESLQNSAMGDQESPTEYGDEFIRTVRERLGIDNVTDAQNLVIAAYADGQLAFNDNGTPADEADDSYSNYIGWYSDDAGNYLGFWDKDSGITSQGAPEGATWINKSYGYLGTAGDSDMMHVVVMLSTHVDSGMQVMQYKIPASLIPMVTYEVELDGSDPTKMKSLSRKEAFPLRLVYEVGLQDGINSVNMVQKVQEAVDAGYGHSHINADGSYSFYTNKWGHEHEGDHVDYNDPMHHEVAKSHFHPAVGNDRYYYTDDTPVYVKNGNDYVQYNGNAAPAGDGYYRAHHYYTGEGFAKEGYTTEYLPMSEYALEQAAAKGKQADGYWYIPEGSVFQQIDRFKMLKEENTTGTLEYYDYPVVVDVGDKYDTYAFLGNNGRLTLTPAQGIKLTKTVTETVAGAEDSFTFDVTLSQAVEDPLVTDSDGKALTGWSVNGNVITVTLKAGETVCITGLPTGVTYTVTERKHADYIGSSQNATGVVESNTIKPVDFVNVPRGYGNLIISKDVDHPYTVVPDALTNKEFTINVKLAGEDVANKQFAVAGTDPVQYVTTDANGSFSVTLKDNGSLTVVGLPEGTTFTTTETLDAQIHKGFTMDADCSVLSGTIQKNTTVQTHVVNIYKPAAPEISIQVAGNKILTDEAGAFDWTGKSFTVRLEQYDPVAGTYKSLDEKQVTQGNLAYLFADNINLTELGNYYFKVSEVIPDERLEGMSYDATVGRFEVRVTDTDVDGVMEWSVRDVDTGAQLAAQDGVITYVKNFENIHTTDATAADFDVYKTVLDNHNTGVTAAGFLFELYEVVSGQTSETAHYSMRTVMDGTQGKASFHIPVTETGVRTFILKEQVPTNGDKIPGMIYDSTEYTVTLTTAAEGGKLLDPVVTITKNGEPVEQAVFENKIELDPIVLKPHVNKTLNGREPLSDSEFTFNIVQTDGSFATPITDGYSDSVSVGEGDKYFKEITITQVGTYYFRTTEVIGNAGGMTYDNSIYHVTVNVTAQNGQLVKEVSVVKVGVGVTSEQTDGVRFTNTYVNNDTAEVAFKGNKTLTGRSLITGEFSFQLKKGNEVLQTVTNRADGSFVFAPITYTAADVGTHTYTIVEVDAGKGGVDYDEDIYTVTVVVTDNWDGTLSVSEPVYSIGQVTYDQAEFQNTYSTTGTSVSFGGTKSWYNTDLDASKAMNGGEFTFALYESNADYSMQGAEVAKTTNDNQGDFGFTLNYHTADHYYYLLREVTGQEETVGYDAAVYRVHIAVYDNGLGQLVGSVAEIYKVGTGTSEIAFSNSYTPKETEAVIQGIKTLTGRTLHDGEFDFQLIDADGQVLETVSNTGANFAFTAISYTKSGTYTYTVREVVPEDAVNNVYNGVAYDTSVFDVTVTVTDNNGQLDASVSVSNGGSDVALAFENTYTITNFATFDLSGSKTLFNSTTNESMDISAYEGKFRFDLYAGDVRVASAYTDSQGNFYFYGIPLESDDEEHTFKLVEYEGDLGGIGYDGREYIITVRAHDNGNGTQSANVVSIKSDGVDREKIAFANTYSLDKTETHFRVSKVLENKQLTAGMFEFLLLDSEGKELQRKPNLAAGGVLFDAIEYEKPGTYTYTIKEVNGGSVIDGITYDAHEITVKVDVVDNGDGTMSANVTYEGLRQFTNTYNVMGDPQFSLSGTKELTGRDLKNNEFTFVLKDTSGNEVQTVSNTGTGFSFNNVELPGLGTHHFTVTEKNTGKGGVSYDGRTYSISVTVSDNGKGGMSVGAPVVTLNGVATHLVFSNSYYAEPAQYQPVAQKNYKDSNDVTKTLLGGEFEFTLTGEGENQTKKNAAGGVITFDTLTFTEAKTYIYEVREVKDVNKPYIAYDDTVYTVKIKVDDDGSGQLKVTKVTYLVGTEEKSEMLFENTYTLASTGYTLTAQKDYTKELTGGEFEFTLTGEGQNQTKTNGAGGTITFDTLTFTEAKTYTYTVKETKGDKSYITYDDTVYTVTIQVADDNMGQLFVKNVTVADNKLSGNTSVKFDNVYVITGEPVFSVSGTKELTGRDPVDGEFTFVLTDSEGSPVEVANVGKTFSFNNVKLPGLGTHTFTVTEKNTGVGTITYDAAKYTVTVTVVDNNEGGMTVQTPVITLNDVAGELVFRNVYTEPDPITVDVNITKTVEGNLSPKGFQFELIHDGKVAATVQTDENGKAVLPITFHVDAVGSYAFTLREVNTGVKHVTYDAAQHKLQVTVTETADGQLAAAVKLDDQAVEKVHVTFVNKYDPPTTPETGDSSNTGLLIGLMGVSALGIIVLLAVLVLDRKKSVFEQ